MRNDGAAQPIDHARRRLLGAAAMTLVAAELGVIRAAAAQAAASAPSPAQLALLGAQQWLNTPPLRAEDIRGKVIAVNFWTYSCINSLRALPYVRSWAQKYRDRGLVVIGVHTPEFGFEKDIANVRQATTSLRVGYPVATDNDYGIWRAFRNDGWPAFHFIGPDGSVRHRMVGEGDYDKSERLIQQLLSAATGSPITDTILAANGTGAEAPADAPDLRSPETYIGYAQARNLASPGGVRADTASLYQPASALSLNRWSLAGVWTVGGEFATLNDPSGSIRYRFHARDLHLVLAPASPGQSVRFRIKLDGAAPGADHGVDADAAGQGRVEEPRMYQLVRQAGPVADRTFEIEFLDAGIRAYVFTFG